MELVRDIKIRHFKSLENVEIRGCRRYNLFVGRPNVGKSNILEALTLFDLPLMGVNKSLLGDWLRCEEVPSLFWNGDVSKAVEVEAYSNDGSNGSVPAYSLSLEYRGADALTLKVTEDGKSTVYDVADLRLTKLPEQYPAFKPYRYDRLRHSRGVSAPFLFPLSGENLMNTVQRSERLREELLQILSRYGLGLTFDTGTQELKFIKELGHGMSFIVPFVSIADTIKRLIYYKAAVYSNIGSLLMLEEPEAHAFPPYIVDMVYSIIDSPQNQYFITTHSPYVVNEFLENKADVALFVIDYRDGRTVVRPLTEEEIQQVYEYGIDMFFNNELFLED